MVPGVPGAAIPPVAVRNRDNRLPVYSGESARSFFGSEQLTQAFPVS